jgi:hypothetical protein
VLANRTTAVGGSREGKREAASDNPWLDGKTLSLEVGNRPAAYIHEVEEEEEEELNLVPPTILGIVQHVARQILC